MFIIHGLPNREENVRNDFISLALSRSNLIRKDPNHFSVELNTCRLPCVYALWLMLAESISV